VFLWRSIGGGLRDESGIFAEARVVTRAKPLPSPPDEQELWADEADRTAVVKRVRIEFRRLADKGSLLRRRLLEDDPIVGDLSIFERPRQTNYPISVEQADRIAVVWSGLGLPWSRDELMAALWIACVRRYQPSEVGGDPTPEFALRSGRSVTRVKAAAETFYRMAPDLPAGRQVFGNKSERQIWDDFFDQKQRAIDLPNLNNAYASRWTTGSVPTITVDGEVAFPPRPDTKRDAAEEANLLECTLAELLRAYSDARSPIHPNDDTRGEAQSDDALDAPKTRVGRSQIVIAIAKVRADFRCEISGCPIEPFTGLDGRPYVEVHHVVPLGEGGADAPENVAALCPMHHREAHHGVRAGAIRKSLQWLRYRH
jgi:hypothetical protein